MYDPKHVGVKEFYVILMCFLINMCMSWLLLTLILSMHGSTMKPVVGPTFKGQTFATISQQWGMEPTRFPATARTNERTLANNPEVQIS